MWIVDQVNFLWTQSDSDLVEGPRQEGNSDFVERTGSQWGGLSILDRVNFYGLSQTQTWWEDPDSELEGDSLGGSVDFGPGQFFFD